MSRYSKTFLHKGAIVAGYLKNFTDEGETLLCCRADWLAENYSERAARRKETKAFEKYLTASCIVILLWLFLSTWYIVTKSGCC